MWRLNRRAILQLIGNAAWRMRYTVTRCSAAYFSGLSRRSIAGKRGTRMHLWRSAGGSDRTMYGLHYLEP